MKKTVSINIGGIIFNIDEDAYEKLHAYLAEIDSRFSNAEEGKEIIADIEARIAELFNQRVNPLKQVINIEDVDVVIGIMGTPEDFGGDESAQEKEKEKQAQEPSEKNWRDKRIYRDPDHRVLGGVCSGLGAYFKIDPVFMRILMIITFFAFGPLLYILLWIAIPKAKTTAQKLEMKGEKVNISNIERSIKEEFEEVKQNFKNMKNSQTYRDSGNVVEKIGHLIVVVLSALGKLFVIFFGILFIIVGLALLIGFLTTFVFGVSDISLGDASLSASQFMGLFLEGNDYMMAFVCIILLIAIPLLALIYGGIKMIFKLKIGHPVIGWSLTAVWIVCLIYMIVFGVGEGRNFRMKDHVQSSIIIREKADTLFLSATPGKEKENKTRHHHEFDYDEHNVHFSSDETDIRVIDGEPRIFGSPMINIEKGDSNYIEVITRKTARGNSQKMAKENARNINYDWKNSPADSVHVNLQFENSYMLNKGSKWRNPEVNVTVKVPAGKVIVLDKTMSDLLYDVQNSSDTPDDEMAGKTWTMKKEGLTPVK